MGTLKKTEWSEKKIQDILIRNFLSPSSKRYEMTGLYVYDWESDYLAITKSNYVYECEIKISRSDFIADQKKQRKHLILEGKNFALKTNGEYPNYFYYAVPDGLISVDEVPEYAGLIYCKPYGIEIVKQAPKISKEPANLDNLKLVDKFYYNMLSWKAKCEENDIQELKRRIKVLEKDCYNYDEMLSEATCEIDELKLKLKKYEDGGN